jgi:phytoene dehydrogenase-like protein
MQTHVPFEVSDPDWDRLRTAYRQRCWEALVEHFPELGRARLLFAFCDTPLDIERRFGTTRRGSIRQGALVPEQTLTGRPHPSCSTGRTPVPGLYLGGGAVHPGVPGSLGGGYNVAALVAEDLGLRSPAAR